MALACGQIFANLWAFGFCGPARAIRGLLAQLPFASRYDDSNSKGKVARMCILNISAQKPDSMGSGVYLAEMVRCELSAGHAAAVVASVDASDEPTLPEGAEPYFVRFNTEALPFNVCGMSDVMPYFGAKSIGPTLSQCQPRSRTADIPVGFLGHRVCGGLFRIGYAFPHKNLRLQGYSFRLHPARATLTLYTATPRSTTNSAPSSFCTRSVCPICLEGEATLAHLQRVRHSAPSLDVSFFAPVFLMGW